MSTTKKELLLLHDKLCTEALEVMRKKNQDYTGTNPDPFANFRGVSIAMGVEPEISLMVRMGDKFQRVKSFIENGFLAVEDEGIDDLGHDLINYSVLLTGMLKERKAAIEEAGGPVSAIAKATQDEEEQKSLSKKHRKKILKKRDKKVKRKYNRKGSIEGPAGGAR